MRIRDSIVPFLGRALLLSVLSLSRCTAAAKVTEPVTSPIGDVLRRLSCISVDVPPITMTPERTAAERQLIGEEKELMPNGWLISSSSYVSPGAIAGAPPAVRPEFRLLSLYDDIILRYRYLDYLGEGRDGSLSFVPAKVAGRELSGQERLRLQQIVNDVNQARRHIFEYYLKESQRKADDFRTSFFAAAGRTEWVRDLDGRYVRKSTL